MTEIRPSTETPNSAGRMEPQRYFLKAALAFAGLLLLFPCKPCSAQEQGANFFAEQVWPILQARCVHCHGPELQEAGFALHTKAALLEGGSRGQAIDLESPDDSVLLKMIQLDAHPRMPFEEPPLSKTEIVVLEKWVQEGAIYEQVNQSIVTLTKWQRRYERYAGLFSKIGFAPIRSPFGISKWLPFWPLVVGVPGWLVFRYVRRLSTPARSAGRWGPAVTFLVAVNACLLGEYFYDCLQPGSMRGMHHQVHLMFGDPPVPVNMSQDAALSRVYYRGNDERSEEMFNNGHYLTCRFHVSLVDQAGRLVESGTSITEDQELFFRLQIERAPFTPDVLFDEEMLGNIFVTSEADIDRCADAADLTRLKTVVPNVVWNCDVPLKKVPDQEELFEQRFYVWQTVPYKYSMSIPKLHYAANVLLDVDQGVIQPSSTLWFNAMRYTRPFTSFAMPADQWLSIHPIPELPAPNTESPALLGLSEHTKNRK